MTNPSKWGHDGPKIVTIVARKYGSLLKYGVMPLGFQVVDFSWLSARVEVGCFIDPNWFGFVDVHDCLSFTSASSCLEIWDARKMANVSVFFKQSHNMKSQLTKPRGSSVCAFSYDTLVLRCFIECVCTRMC